MKIVARRRTQASNGSERGDGYSYEYKLDNGEIISNEQAYEMALNNQIEGIIASHNKDTKYIKAYGDGNIKNNLDDLPEF